MNTVTIKAKAQLAAKRIGDHANDYSENGMAAIIESCFTPDSSFEDLIEALQALKTLRETICNSVMPLSGKTSVVSSCIYEAGKILKKHPNLI